MGTRTAVSYEYLDSIDSRSAVLEPRRRAAKARWPLVAKAAIAIALCGFIVARIEWDAAWSSLVGVGWGSVAAMFAILTAIIFLSAYKWRLLLAIHGIEYSLLRLSKYYFVALFLNNFLPTSIGGDGYRIYKTFNNGRSRASAVIAVAMERLTGFGTLLVLGAGAALLLAADTTGRDWPLLVLAGVFACAAAALFAGRIPSLVPVRLRAFVPERVRALLATLWEHVDDYRRQPGRSIAVLVLSVVFHLCLTFAYFVLLRYGAEQSVTMLQLLTVLTISTLVAVLPISINGLGVFEGTFIYMLSQYGVPAEVSIVPMILNRGLLIMLSLAGASVYLFDTSPNAKVQIAG